jgi:predicted HicB family RNase H-like nuclease
MKEDEVSTWETLADQSEPVPASGIDFKGDAAAAVGRSLLEARDADDFFARLEAIAHPGRPRLDERPAPSVKVNLRLSDSLAREVAAAAALGGVTRSRYMREAIARRVAQDAAAAGR